VCTWGFSVPEDSGTMFYFVRLRTCCMKWEFFLAVWSNFSRFCWRKHDFLFTNVFTTMCSAHAMHTFHECCMLNESMQPCLMHIPFLARQYCKKKKCCLINLLKEFFSHLGVVIMNHGWNKNAFAAEPNNYCFHSVRVNLTNHCN